MKRISFLCLVVLVFAVSACKQDEQLRAEAVAGAYDCYANCLNSNLATQDPPVTVLDTAILYVTPAYDDENGFVKLMGQEVYIEKDYSFRKSVTNYTLSGKFDGSGGLEFSIDLIDVANETRSQCSYVCQLRP